MEVGVKAAKADLSRLIKAALGGEKVIITDRGKPLVQLVPEAPRPQASHRGFGSLKGLLQLRAGWDSVESKSEMTSLFEDLE